MEAKKETPPLPPIVDQIKEYAETRVKLFKYQAIEGSSTVIADVVSDIAMIVVVLIAILFASFTLGFYLGDVFGAQWKGFGCVTVLYILIAFIVKACKARIESSLIQKFIKILFKTAR